MAKKIYALDALKIEQKKVISYHDVKENEIYGLIFFLQKKNLMKEIQFIIPQIQIIF